MSNSDLVGRRGSLSHRQQGTTNAVYTIGRDVEAIKQNPYPAGWI